MHNISDLEFKNAFESNTAMAQKGMKELFKNSGLRNNFVKKSS